MNFWVSNEVFIDCWFDLVSDVILEAMMSSVEHLARSILADLVDLFPQMYKNPREKLAMMVACLVETRSCNTMELAARLPIETDRNESRYMWIERFLSASTIDDTSIMDVLARRLLATLCERGRTVLISIDQTALDDERAIGMVSARVGERALPLFWVVKRTAGDIAIKDYLPLLERLKACLCEDAKVIVLADRFFGGPEMIGACQRHGWSYRIRLKGDLTLLHEGGELSVRDIARPGNGLTEANLCASGVIINIGFVHDKGHKEPWFIAMDAQPTRKTTLDYGLRWSIETMFADFKSRGFGFQHTQLQRPDRISRMLLVLAIALTWATANGHAAQKNSSPLAIRSRHPGLRPKVRTKLNRSNRARKFFSLGASGRARNQAKRVWRMAGSTTSSASSVASFSGVKPSSSTASMRFLATARAARPRRSSVSVAGSNACRSRIAAIMASAIGRP
jgi:hypothetical protein